MSEKPTQDEPDRQFSLGSTGSTDPAEKARKLTHRIARELAAIGPEGWQRLDGVFALTVADEAAELIYTDGERSVRAAPPEATVHAVRELRALSAHSGDGPWLRLVLSLTKQGQLEAEYDYGDSPLPPERLFPADAYRADLEAFPRRLPTWLAAYVDNTGHQVRTPEQAARAAVRAVAARPAHALPPLPALWARWASLAAAHVAVGSERGPRILPSLGWYEDGNHNGATLYLLSRDRAVLSGGRLNSAELAAGYHGEAAVPDLYAGAPSWVTSAVLNPRAATGMLSFCYWWQSGSWRRGESPEPAPARVALPELWDEDAVVELVVDLVLETGDPRPEDEIRDAAETVVGSAEVGLVTRETIVPLFADAERFDSDAAYAQFDAAGVATVQLTPLPEEDAIALVRDYILERGLETPGYPVSGLVASRVGVGWMVHVPAPEGQLMMGRAIFYVADDGAVERSSSSTPPSVYAAGFEQRFRWRLDRVG
ncbi:hypothetical protein ACLMAJ_17800 [Nocardia sp. KC 131]|uniref:hypothetical protein n=1 Tax=Nocardia arseniciresistens TaxID=3392119 RepID=UPI00398F72FB